MKRSNLVIIGCIAGGAGVYAARYYDASFMPFLLGVLSLFAIKRKTVARTACIVLVVFWLGNARGTIQNQGFEILRNHFETKTTLVATSIDDAEYDSRGQLAFNANNIVLDGEKLPGQIAVSGFGEFSVLKGDSIEVRGKLFSARGSNQARMSFAQIDTIRKDVSWYNRLRRQFIKKLRDNLPEPLSSFAAGLIIGQRSTIPDDVINDLRNAGLAHIIAVSGYNLTIIVRAVMALLKKCSRYQKLASSLAIIAAFLLITGFSASIVRAGIVSLLSLLAWYYGRNFRPAVLLLVSAFATILYKPEYIWGDVGWYLSFLAFGGVMILAPIIRVRLYGDKKLKFLKATLIETMAVLFMIIPYSLYIFGTLSVVALPANILIAPTIPLSMALAVFVAFVPHQLAVLAIPTVLVLDGTLAVAHLFSSLPFAHIDIKISQIDMLLLYGLICILCYMMWRKTKQRLESSVLLQ